MTSIWAFCLQTLTVSLSALLLLLIKRLLADKLSPRWQYGIWVILGLRILIPASIRRDVILPLGLVLEMAKSAAEEVLDSSFSAVLSPVSMSHVFPLVRADPTSVTDWLFVIYAAGVVLWGLYYLVSYIILRLRLRRGRPASEATYEAMNRICRQYGLKPCRVVAVPTLDSAFVCGVFRPILAVPSETEVDDKVILHELLHLKHRDVLQGIFWAVGRCLHWCNPLMHYIFNRIGNDMESLCDQRVLEQLEGEERREYGRILLSMANRRYARTPGTGSISNGRKNISRRIAAIVRFKKYPKGMSLVSFCIGIVLLSPLLVGTATAYDSLLYQPENAAQLKQAMAVARVRRCSTAAGAIDTYAKGLMQQNVIYLATATPVSTHEALLAQTSENWYTHAGEGLEYLDPYTESYQIYDLHSQDDGSFSAYLTFSVTDFEDSSQEDWPTDNNGVPIVSGTLIIPLRIFREDGCWVVEERAPRIQSHTRYNQIQFYGDDMPWLAEQTIVCETGTVTVRHRGSYYVDNTVDSTISNIFGWTSFDTSINPDARFSSGSLNCEVVYEFDRSSTLQPRDNVALYVWYFETAREFETGSAGDQTPQYSNNSGGNYFDCYFNCLNIYDRWDGTLTAGPYISSGGEIDTEDLPTLPAGYIVQIVFDGEVVEELRIEVTQP